MQWGTDSVSHISMGRLGQGERGSESITALIFFSDYHSFPYLLLFYFWCSSDCFNFFLSYLLSNLQPLSSPPPPSPPRPNHTSKQTLKKKKDNNPNLTNHHFSYKRGCVLSLPSIILFYVNSLTSASPPLRDRTLVLPPNRPLEDFPTPIISLGRWPL